MKRNRSAPLPQSLICLLMVGSTISCVEDGTVPQCPTAEGFLLESGEFDVEAWREAAEQDGCLTPIGGVNTGGAGGSGS